MTLEQARQFYYTFSGKASEITRALSLGGIAVVWALKFGPAGGPLVPADLRSGLLLLFVSLAFDVLQYGYGAVAWGWFSRFREKRGEEENFLAPRWINWATDAFFTLKVAAMMLGYFLLAWPVMQRLGLIGSVPIEVEQAAITFTGRAMTTAESWNLTIQSIAAVTSIFIIVLAIWGDSIRARWVGPKLSIRLANSVGDLTKQLDGKPVRYYHLIVSNLRPWQPAKNSRALITSVTNESPSGATTTFIEDVQLTWKFPTSRPQFITLSRDETCDLGCIAAGGDFWLSTYHRPNNRKLHMAPGEKMEVEVRAAADGCESKPIRIQLYWDGTWSDDGEKMRRHLVIGPSSA